MPVEPYLRPVPPEALAGRVVAIAGAAGGLGPTVAAACADAGATLALAGREVDALGALAGGLGLPDERVDAAAVDLLDPAATRAWADGLAARFGHVDVLLHLVGGYRGGTPLATAPLVDVAFLHDVLVRTVIHATQAFAPHLAASAHGRFLLVSSSQALRPNGTNAPYGAMKAAAEAWTWALADSFAGTAATANVLAVHAIVTPEMRAEAPEQAFASLTPAEDVAAALVFACSDAGGRMNGQRIALHR